MGWPGRRDDDLVSPATLCYHEQSTQIAVTMETVMATTITATFDGEVLRLDEPLELAPQTRVRITLVSEPPPCSFLQTAKSLNLEGPPDWSDRLESYLYGDAINHEDE